MFHCVVGHNKKPKIFGAIEEFLAVIAVLCAVTVYCITFAKTVHCTFFKIHKIFFISIKWFFNPFTPFVPEPACFFSDAQKLLCKAKRWQQCDNYQNQIFHGCCLFCYQFNTLFVCIVFRVSVLEYSQCAVVPLDIAPQTSGQFHQFSFACSACLKKFTINLLTRWRLNVLNIIITKMVFLRASCPM